jgi:hypothetical protein
MTERTFRILAYIIVLAVVISLAISNVMLRRRLDVALRARTVGSDGMFHVGDDMPSFNARDRADHVVRIGGVSDHQRVFIFVLSGCDSCEKVLSSVSANPGANTAIVSILPPQPSAEAKKAPPSVPIYFVEDFGPLRAHARHFPQILRVTEAGKVAEVCASYKTCLDHSMTSASPAL